MSDQLEPVGQKAVEMGGSVREQMSDATREAPLTSSSACFCGR
jgi:hypothetical protein